MKTISTFEIMKRIAKFNITKTNNQSQERYEERIEFDPQNPQIDKLCNKDYFDDYKKASLYRNEAVILLKQNQTD